MKMETQLSQTYRMQQKYSKREVHSDTGFPEEARKISNNLTLNKRNQKKKSKAQNQYKEGNNKDDSRNN